MNQESDMEGDSNSPRKPTYKLVKPDLLVLEAKRILEGAGSESYKYKGMVDSARHGLDIRVMPKNIRRALYFMDILIKLFRSRGHDVILEREGTYVKIKNEKIKIACREKTRIVEKPKDDRWAARGFEPTGILTLKSEGTYRYEWKDGRTKLEDQISDILARLEMKVDELYAYWEHNRKAQEVRKEQERLIQEIEKRKEQELTDFKKLLNESFRWHRVKIIRDYINEVKVRADATSELSEDLRTWHNWANIKADWYDPTIEREDELLKDVDRDTLKFKTKPSTLQW